ncbi:cobalamin adenosyltransferase [Clostridium scatologenes]|uniref:Cobalamin adenosyltransferase n=1 Tax=Clostridium scatologenes TaxID=1548 RepID=A0A0E3JN12_CLOSL|nr:cobalamin adenosyltransferase [Clostridium scatologenes]AKA68742.1 cobalamin adenosyltransferase [Clostridium scatologenes]
MVLTEAGVRRELKNLPEGEKNFQIEKGVIVTPSARQYLNDRNVKLVVVDKLTNKNSKVEASNQSEDSGKIFPKYKCFQGGYLEEKPEHMTQLYGNKLVFKDHKKIVLRGKIDSLESKILETQVLSVKLQNEKLALELEEILSFVREILRCEVLEKPLGDINLIGMNEKEIREISHDPKKYFNMEHFFTSYKMGEIVVSINSLRSAVREVEIEAFKAFKNEEGEVSREDIIRALNRLSSCFYVIMFRCLTGKYK